MTAPRKLFEPTRFGRLLLSNRIVMAPMTRCRADAEGRVGEMTVRYYRQRATAGLIITEATNISPDAQGSPMTPGIWSNDQVQAWKKVTSAVHSAGGSIVMQLWHTGRVGHSNIRNGQRPVAPSAIAIQGQKHFTPQGPQDYEVPRELTLTDIQTILNDYEHAARNAREAGFDGVELHGAFGYLPHQFLVDSANQRTDGYGGSIENRARFILEVLDRLIRVWGEGRVGIRISPTIAYNGMADSDPLATFSYLIGQLNDLPLAYLHLMRATPDPVQFPGWPQDTVGVFGPLFHGNVLVNGGYVPDEAESTLQAGKAHAVSFGSLFVANPDLVRRFETGSPLAEGDPNTYYHGGETGYVEYPELEEHSPTKAKGYWLVLAKVTDPAGFSRYTEIAGPCIASYGGRVLARGEVREVVEGSIPKRPFLIEFPSLRAATACFHSTHYQDAIARRADNAEFDIAILEG